MSRNIAEQRILAAIARGELDNLKGAGQPLPEHPGGLFADSVGFRIMAAAGALPEEVRLRKAIEAERAALAALPEGAGRVRALALLGELEMRLGIQVEARRRTAGP